MTKKDWLELGYVLNPDEYSEKTYIADNENDYIRLIGNINNISEMHFQWYYESFVPKTLYYLVRNRENILRLLAQAGHKKAIRLLRKDKIKRLFKNYSDIFVCV